MNILNILVIGGTRFMGVHLVNQLIKDGHKITIANRGKTPDNFGDSVERICLERTDADSISNELKDKEFDIVYDSLAFCSNDVKYLLDTLKCRRYIQISSLSVYMDFKENLIETDFDPNFYSLKWCDKTDFDYSEIKRQAECAVFQVYGNVPSVSVRLPYVIGADDYTKRLYFYVEHVVKSIPMFVDNLNAKMAFVDSSEAGRFLAYLAENDFCGCINASSCGNISLYDIISYVENKTGIKATFSENGEKAPYNGTPQYSLNLQKSENIGFTFSHINTWIYNLLDEYIDLAKK